MAKIKPYRVVLTTRAGIIGIDIEMSRHASKNAAWRAAHKLKRSAAPGDYVTVRDEDDKILTEVWTYRNGRRVWI